MADMAILMTSDLDCRSSAWLELYIAPNDVKKMHAVAPLNEKEILILGGLTEEPPKCDCDRP